MGNTDFSRLLIIPFRFVSVSNHALQNQTKRGMTGKINFIQLSL